MDMENFYERFCDEKFTKRGVLCDFTLKYSENYNFAYDVMDEIARLQPNRRAMIWCNEAGEEHTFSFSDLKRMSDKTANMLRTHGVKKGDMVMLVLKRHFEFWFSILALHKLGAVAIPATNLLTKKDFEYRFEAAGVKAVLCTADGEVAEHVDMACEEYKGLSSKIIVNGKRDGWYSFTDEVEKASENFERVETKAHEPMLLYFTSGTTGYPKMVIHDHTYSLGHIITAKYWHNVDPDGIHLSISDTGWGKAAWGKLYGQCICL